MDRSPIWLKDAADTPWASLAAAIGAGLPVPNGFVVTQHVPEESIRAAYEDLKVSEHTHFVAIRGPSHALLDTIGSDPVVHTLRRFWAETPDAMLLIQRMVTSASCGTADWDGRSGRRILRIRANEGMQVFDPDIYVFNAITGKCTRKTIQEKQRKTIRRVDGIDKTIEVQNQRRPLGHEVLREIADLATRADAGISWAADDNSRLWLISIHLTDR
jgi:hypothetical protein